MGYIYIRKWKDNIDDNHFGDLDTLCYLAFIKSFLFSFSNVDEFYNSKFNSLTSGAGRGFALTSDFKGRRDHLYILDSWQPDLFAPPLGPDLKGPFSILLTPIRLLKNNYQYRSYKNIRWPS